MPYIVSSWFRQRSLDGLSERCYRCYWRYAGYTVFPSNAKRFKKFEDAEYFRDRRLENGWAKARNIEIDPRIEEVNE